MSSEYSVDPVTEVGAAQTEGDSLEQVIAEGVAAGVFRLPSEPAPEPAPAIVRVLAEPEQVRVGGQAGVRVTQLGGVRTTKRVTSVNDEADHRAVPVEVLAEVRAVLDGPVPPAAGPDALRAVRDLLAPWL